MLLVLSLAPRVSFPNSNSIWNAQTFKREFVRTPKCCVGILITITFSPPPPPPRSLIPKYNRTSFNTPLYIYHNAPYSPPTNTQPPPPPPRAPSQVLHNLCFSFLLGLTAVPREIENTAYAKFLGGKEGALWERWKWRLPV